MCVDYSGDGRVVFTLDAGGTNYVFAAMVGGRKVGRCVRLDPEPSDLQKSISNIKGGFNMLLKETGLRPCAISFAFPGPADYENGVIYNIGNIPAFSGGVPLAGILEHEFGVPVFINNDGDLFTYGEAVAGALPRINNIMQSNGNPKRYKNLFGITLGTGLGGGFVVDGKLYTGDNSNAAEIWLMTDRRNLDGFAEEQACARAVQKNYAMLANISDYRKYSPKDIEDIALGKLEGDAAAAKEAYRLMGESLGDVLCEISRIVDCPIVIGGGVSYGYPLFMEPLVDFMNSKIRNADGREFPRLVQKVYNLEDARQASDFASGGVKNIQIPGTDKKIASVCQKRIGICISELGASNAVSIGAYALALSRIDGKK